MSDSQRPKPAPPPPPRRAPQFEIPDLELEPAPRSIRRSSGESAAAKEPSMAGHGYSAPNLFDEEPFHVGSLSLDLDAGRNDAAVFGSTLNFDDPNSFELEPTAPPAALHHEQDGQAAKGTERGALQGARAAWPSGRAPESAELKLDPHEIAILADYGEVPKAAQLAPAYAYRVFMRQRELKRQLLSIAAECERAQLEREATLAELARAVRPAAEQTEQFRRLFAPLRELEQLAAQRGQALTSINQQLSAQSGQLDAELAQIDAQITAQQALEREAERRYDEREAVAKRAQAKLKRVHIEIRAVTQVAEQRLGAAGGPIPDAEAAQLGALRQRAEAIQPELAQAQAEFAQAKLGLTQVRAQLDALRKSARSANRKQQALGAHYQKEIQTRSLGVSESETQQRAALADLGRAVLGSAGLVEVSEAWLERVRAVSERADRLIVRRELQRRAIDSYDAPRARQGVRLACTVALLFVLLIVFKLIF